ncbi:MAG: hypothetical protein V3U59_05960 [Gammaproteobacteria bacterium]
MFAFFEIHTGEQAENHNLIPNGDEQIADRFIVLSDDRKPRLVSPAKAVIDFFEYEPIRFETETEFRAAPQRTISDQRLRGIVVAMDRVVEIRTTFRTGVLVHQRHTASVGALGQPFALWIWLVVRPHGEFADSQHQSVFGRGCFERPVRYHKPHREYAERNDK